VWSTPIAGARVKLTALAAGVGARRKIRQEPRVEAPARERRGHHARINAREVRLQPALEHLARECIGRAEP
jgi:hypothetical protein